MPVLSHTRLLPDTAREPAQIPLSILDNTVLNFAPTAGIWFFNVAPSIDQLCVSLKNTLVSYPQWSGQLEWAPYNPEGDHTERYHRLILTYGTPNDPGVEFIAATSPRSSSFLANGVVDGCLDLSAAPFDEFLDPTVPLAMHDLVNYTGLPCMIVQVTKFQDEGLAIAVKLAHPLADAQSLLHFVHDWAAVTRARQTGIEAPTLSPLFDPTLLDRMAAGDIDGSYPNPDLMQAARSLPLNRYDWWASSKGCPPALIRATDIPPGLDVVQLGNPLPWDEWDIAAPTSHYSVEFTSRELHAIWEEANSFSPISHLDALLAHVWNLIIRARQLEGPHHLDVTFGFRNRLHPPLPSSFIGSPLTLTKVTSMPHNRTLSHLATSIRSSLKLFDSSALQALLHETAFEASPQRIWNAFLGSRHTIVTSWLHLGIRNVDFGTGPPISVEAVMPKSDGCIQIMEGASYTEGSRWYDGATVVSLHLRDDVMQRLLKDPDLRKYRHENP